MPLDQLLHLVRVDAAPGEHQDDFAGFLLNAAPQLELHVVGLLPPYSTGDRVQFNLVTKAILLCAVQPRGNLRKECSCEISRLRSSQPPLKLFPGRTEFLTAHNSPPRFKHCKLRTCRAAEDRLTLAPQAPQFCRGSATAEERLTRPVICPAFVRVRALRSARRQPQAHQSTAQPASFPSAGSLLIEIRLVPTPVAVGIARSPPLRSDALFLTDRLRIPVMPSLRCATLLLSSAFRVTFSEPSAVFPDLLRILEPEAAGPRTLCLAMLGIPDAPLLPTLLDEASSLSSVTRPLPVVGGCPLRIRRLPRTARREHLLTVGLVVPAARHELFAVFDQPVNELGERFAVSRRVDDDPTHDVDKRVAIALSEFPCFFEHPRDVIRKPIVGVIGVDLGIVEHGEDACFLDDLVCRITVHN
ncbi:hypothetical protein ACFC1I_15950 [Microbacterium sp. NPDC056044]|uniref:hypothetical protein n=1 Tax=Microbacterium sp. NPDC056044 TaxID=3345690 RepID=UPI0035E2AD9B